MIAEAVSIAGPPSDAPGHSVPSPKFGRVLSVLPPAQLFSRLIAAAWPLFPSPVVGWTSHGRPEILLLPEPRLPRPRPARPRQSPRLLPLRPQQAAPRPGLPHLPATLFRAQRHPLISLQTS